MCSAERTFPRGCQMVQATRFVVYERDEHGAPWQSRSSRRSAGTAASLSPSRRSRPMYASCGCDTTTNPSRASCRAGSRSRSVSAGPPKSPPPTPRRPMWPAPRAARCGPGRLTGASRAQAWRSSSPRARPRCATRTPRRPPPAASSSCSATSRRDAGHRWRRSPRCARMRWSAGCTTLSASPIASRRHYCSSASPTTRLRRCETRCASSPAPKYPTMSANTASSRSTGECCASKRRRGDSSRARPSRGR